MTSSVALIIETKLKQALQPATLIVTALDEGSAKYDVKIVAAAFVGKSLIQRHRLVNDALKEELLSGVVHALTISAEPPAP
jgi:stress-induced morphogen